MLFEIHTEKLRKPRLNYYDTNQANAQECRIGLLNAQVSKGLLWRVKQQTLIGAI
jgi:hypothetical protein